MRIRSVKWKIEEHGDGSYTLWRYRKSVLRNSTLEEVKRKLKKVREKGDQVALIEEDGYATEVTRRLNLL